MRLISYRHFVSDVNECKKINATTTTGKETTTNTISLAGCDQQCHNTNGSFFCSCNKGYRLLNDNTTCEGMCPYMLTVITNNKK